MFSNEGESSMQRFSLVFLSILALAASCLAQNPVPPDIVAGRIAIQSEDAPLMMVLQDGTARASEGEVAFFSVMAGGAEIIKNAPYSATSVTESTQTLADGNRISNQSSSFFARDSQGRTRHEHSMEMMGRLQVGGPKMVLISDPVSHTEYILQPEERTARVIKREAGDAAGMMHRKMEMMHGEHVSAHAEEKHEVKQEDLGTQDIEGVSCQGKRMTVTIPAGKMGNERPIVITTEIWSSAELHTVVLKKHSDPRIGETVYRLTNIKLGEPDPSLFQLPSGYKSIVKDESFTRE
jgi:hypothetical protein